MKCAYCDLEGASVMFGAEWLHKDCLQRVGEELEEAFPIEDTVDDDAQSSEICGLYTEASK